LKEAEVEMISISLLVDNPSDYKKMMVPTGGLGFADVCSFIVLCAENGKKLFAVQTNPITESISFTDFDVTCTAVEKPGIKIDSVRSLAFSLGARSFVTSSYHP